MVLGIDSFREKFKAYTDYYTIIGGTACDILLTEADLPFFYKFMMSGRRVVDGIGVLGAEHLIPFKIYAWINLLERKRAGEHVNEKDLKKHKYDVFR